MRVDEVENYDRMRNDPSASVGDVQDKRERKLERGRQTAHGDEISRKQGARKILFARQLLVTIKQSEHLTKIEAGLPIGFSIKSRVALRNLLPSRRLDDENGQGEGASREQPQRAEHIVYGCDVHEP